MFLFDTNIWLEVLLSQSNAHQVKRLMGAIPSNQIHISDFSLHSIGLRLYKSNSFPDYEIFYYSIFIDGDVRVTGLHPNEIIGLDKYKRNFGFDFDDAYEDWRDLGGTHIVTDVELGLCRKLDGKNAHAFLLPIPNNALKAQVWDDTNPNEKIKPNPQFCVEHIFWGIED